jgi:hypothetical protein
VCRVKVTLSHTTPHHTTPSPPLPPTRRNRNVVDTVCLGQWAGTAELAAMGPACIIFAFAQYIFQALQISTVT